MKIGQKCLLVFLSLIGNCVLSSERNVINPRTLEILVSNLQLQELNALIRLDQKPLFWRYLNYIIADYNQKDQLMKLRVPIARFSIDGSIIGQQGEFMRCKGGKYYFWIIEKERDGMYEFIRSFDSNSNE